jgi:hypothetical protein
MFSLGAFDMFESQLFFWMHLVFFNFDDSILGSWNFLIYFSLELFFSKSLTLPFNIFVNRSLSLARSLVY